MTFSPATLHDKSAFIDAADYPAAWAATRALWPQLPLAEFNVVPWAEMPPGTAAAEATFAAHPLITETEGTLNDEIAHLTLPETPLNVGVWWHEVGHAIEWEALEVRYPDEKIWNATDPEWNAPDNSVMTDFWKARGLPGTFAQSLMSGHWGGLGYEEFAEAFKRVMCGALEVTDDANIPWPGDDRMLAFFRGLFPVVTPTTVVVTPTTVVVTPPAPTPAPTPVPAPVPQPTVTPRLMFDSITPADIPDGSALVAGYVDGPKSKWPDAAWSSFPGRTLVRITITGDPTADVFDVESGAGRPEDAPAYARARRALGKRPCVYVNLSNVDAVRAAFGTEPQPLYWLAHYGAPPIVPDGYVAIQYANERLTGAHYDASVVLPGWPEGEDMNDQDIYDAVMRVARARLDANKHPDPAYDLADTNAALKDTLAALGNKTDHHIHETTIPKPTLP